MTSRMTDVLCERCGTLYQRDNWRHEQRFCSRTCARLKGTEIVDPMQPMADRCSRFVLNCGDKRGVTPRDLSRYIGDDYRKLCDDDRFRVHVLICKTPGIAFAAEDEEFRYWPRAVAPEGATRAP